MEVNITINWRTDEMPLDKEGCYLVWLSGRTTTPLETCYVRKVSNGFIRIIGGYFDHDFLTEDCQIVAWCDAPKFVDLPTSDEFFP